MWNKVEKITLSGKTRYQPDAVAELGRYKDLADAVAGAESLLSTPLSSWRFLVYILQKERLMEEKVAE